MLAAKHPPSLVRLTLPYATVIGATFAEWVPLPLLHYFPLAYHFLLMVVYFWALKRPALMPYWLMFLLGLLSDIAQGTPLGLQAFRLLSMRLLAARLREQEVSMRFSVYVVGFAGLYLLVLLLSYLLAWSIVADGRPAFAPLALTYVVNLAIYPLVHLLLQRLQRLSRRR